MTLDNRALGVSLSLTIACCAMAGLTCAPPRGAIPATSKSPKPGPGPTTEPSISLYVGAPAPNLALVDRAGNSYRPSAYHGRRVVLVFFRDSPECAQFARRWEKIHRHIPELVVLGIAIYGPSEIERFRRGTKVTFPLLFDREYDNERLDQQIRCPTSVIINEDGIISAVTPPDDASAGDAE